MFFCNDRDRCRGFKPIYDANDVPSVGQFVNGLVYQGYTICRSIIEAIIKFAIKDEKVLDNLLFEKFRRLAVNEFAIGGVFFYKYLPMRKNIISMIEKFQRNEGGVYENEILTNYIKKHVSTKRYCDELVRYIKTKLKDNDGDVSKLEDNMAYWETKESEDNRKMVAKKSFFQPTYGTFSSIEDIISGEKWENTFVGATIALNDIWATEVTITEYDLNECTRKYTGKFQVTLWDHFGLDVDDIKWYKAAGYLECFMTWFILQHFRGYKPFITKITFDWKFSGDLKDEVR
jgi:hypothetical protein